ncbi:peptide chain release factor 3 [Aquipuribacter sp. SD81]|uniref:peptide chain release factor 3 n=1 Tax=Aquipuribacter sp. SD81 TaxID=3127703 RepID=UPI0030182A78
MTATDLPAPPATDADGTAPLEAASRRRTFAVISHPDAGKSTLTEALALHGGAIGQAGIVQGKGGRRGVVSDWLDMEKARGISITSAALQFTYRDRVVNLLDTPGHADFSEDTYRVLTAVDSAVMLVDAAKGMERQTVKLFEVCRLRGLPIVTVVNKWDRPGREALELLDEFQTVTGMVPTPVLWPVGIGGDFRGLLDLRDGTPAEAAYIAFDEGSGGATRTTWTPMSLQAGLDRDGDLLATAQEEVELVLDSNGRHDDATFRAGRTTPVVFAAAVLNRGVEQLLDLLVDTAPPPADRPAAGGGVRAVTEPFSGQVFKVQAGMDAAHRDHVAFIRVSSGRFQRGENVVNARTGKAVGTKYAHRVFGGTRSGVEDAWPGDVVAIVNATGVRVGDTLYSGRKVEYPPIPTFAPEHFAVCRAKDLGRYKQFQRGITELHHEGVVQTLRSDLRGEPAPVLAAVGPMQFDVVQHRMAGEFGCEVTLEPLPYQIARRTTAEHRALLDAVPGVEVLTSLDGDHFALFPDRWRLQRIERENPDVVLDALAADSLA